MEDDRPRQLKRYLETRGSPELGLSHNADVYERESYARIKGKNQAYQDVLQELLRLYPELKETTQGTPTPE